MKVLNPIKTFVINLAYRSDRRMHIHGQFAGRDEFAVRIVEAREHQSGSIGLWHSIRHIVGDLTTAEDEYVLICEDDHQFTEEYSAALLFKSIREAGERGADMLSGGVSWLNSGLRVSERLYWVDTFTGLQFTVLFRRFFQRVLDAGVDTMTPADHKLCSLSEKKYFIHPFLSVQKEFGYSDVTPGNNAPGRVETLFQKSRENVRIIGMVEGFYGK